MALVTVAAVVKWLWWLRRGAAGSGGVVSQRRGGQGRDNKQFRI